MYGFAKTLCVPDKASQWGTWVADKGASAHDAIGIPVCFVPGNFGFDVTVTPVACNSLVK